MSVEIYIAICLTIIVIAIGVITTFIALTLWQIKRAATTLESLALRADAQMSRFSNITDVVTNFAAAATGRVGRSASMAAGLAYTLFDAFRRHRARRTETEDDDPL